MNLQIYFFGKFRAQCSERFLTGLEAHNVQRLFAYLLLHRDRPHHGSWTPLSTTFSSSSGACFCTISFDLPSPGSTFGTSKARGHQGSPSPARSARREAVRPAGSYGQGRSA